MSFGRSSLAFFALLLICQTALGKSLIFNSYGQGPDQSISGFTMNAPSIDGYIDPSEWSNAAKLNITLTGSVADIPATMYMMNDDSNIYLAISLQDTDIGMRSLIVQFDENQNGYLEPGEELFNYDPVYWSGLGLSPTNFDWHVISVDQSSESYDFDSNATGSTDGQAQGSQGSNSNDYEFSHPLCSTDTEFDFCLSPGDMVSFAILYSIQDAGKDVWPSGIAPGQDASNYHDLIIGEAPSEPEPPADSLPFGTSITTGYFPYPEEIHSFIFGNPGAQTMNVPSPSTESAVAMFVEVTAYVQNAVLEFDNDGIQYQYHIVPNSNALLTFPQNLTISNVRLTIDDRGYSNDTGYVGYILPPPPETEPDEPPSPNPTESAPKADAGPNQTVEENQVVYLDGSGSTGSQSAILTYSWKQLAGPKVSLHDSNRIYSSFSSPSVAGSVSLRFGLTVTDSQGKSSFDTTTIFVNDVDETLANRSPVADAGFYITTEAGKHVTLSGSGFDADGDEITYSWRQVDGTLVSLANATTPNPSFISPLVIFTETLTFELRVSDPKGAVATDNTVVTVIAPSNISPNQPPMVDAGKNMVVDEGTTVILQGTATDSNPDSMLEYLWIQIEGPQVNLSDPFFNSTSFQAPEITQAQQILKFEFRATDPGGSTSSDQVTIVVKDISPFSSPEQKPLHFVSNVASTSPSESYSLNFTKSRALVSSMPSPNGSLIGLWADVPGDVEGATIHFDSASSAFYFDLTSNSAAGYLFDKPMQFANATLTIASLQTVSANIMIGYYYEEPAVSPVVPITEKPVSTIIDEVESSPPNSNNDSPPTLENQFLKNIADIPLPFLIAGIGITIIVPTSIAIAIRKSHQKNSIPQERRDAALEMAAMLFPKQDPIAEEDLEKGPIIDQLEEELGTTLKPATSISELLKKYAGETEIDPKD